MILLGVISDHRAHRSLSPAMHNAVLERCGLNGAYLPLEVHPDRLEAAVRGLAGLGFTGANVTVPYKEAVMKHLDELAPEVETIGAVNTIVVDRSRIRGHNTDADGLADALSLFGFDSSGASVGVFGTGGAARAALCALKRTQAGSLTVIGRDARKTGPLAAEFGAEALDWTDVFPADWNFDLIVNAASVSAPAEAPALDSYLKRVHVNGARLIFDLNYGRPDNFWQALSRRIGADFMDGRPMLALQAHRGFQIWTGRRDVEPGWFLDALEVWS
jgi:shikimate dehydrogenase